MVFGFLCPLFVPLVTKSGLPTWWKAVISGLLVFGIPEVFMLIAVAVMGKSGFEYIKKLFFKFLRKHGPAEVVSRTRYYIGLVMFLLPLILGFVTPYLGHYIPGYGGHPFAFGIVGDLILLASLFVLGGEFWDKLRSLFVYRAKAQFPANRG